MKSFKDCDRKIRVVVHAWTGLRPGKRFSQLTVQRFFRITDRSRQLRERVKAIEQELGHERARRDEADKASRALLQRVIHAIKGDPAEGEDGELYAAMGYMPRAVRLGRRAAARSREKASQ